MMKRYNFRSITSRMNESVNGEWVKYEDVKAIEKTNEILANRCRSLVGNQTLYDSDFGRITGTQRPREG